GVFSWPRAPARADLARAWRGVLWVPCGCLGSVRPGALDRRGGGPGSVRRGASARGGRRHLAQRMLRHTARGTRLSLRNLLLCVTWARAAAYPHPRSVASAAGPPGVGRAEGRTVEQRDTV